MKKSHKLLSALTLVLILFCSSQIACAPKKTLFDNLSELRSNIYSGSSENFSLSACYGFLETPYINDGKVGKLDNTLTFSLKDKQAEQTTYTVSVELNGKTHSAVFKSNPVTSNLKAVIIIDDFNLDTFDAKISFGSSEEMVTMTSLVPKNTLSPQLALEKLEKEQEALIESFKDSEGNFNAEIYMRVLVKDNKPYYYVGFASGKDKLKALLVDGITGKTLAIREIF